MRSSAAACQKHEQRMRMNARIISRCRSIIPARYSLIARWLTITGMLNGTS